MGPVKPTLEIAVLRDPGHGARRLLQVLAGTATPAWRVRVATPIREYLLFAGMSPGPAVHGALVLVDAARGVTPLLRRALWFARRRGVAVLLGVVVCETADGELMDLAEADLRAVLDEYGLCGDELPLLRVVWSEAAAARAELLGALDERAAWTELRRDAPDPHEARVLPALRRVAFRRTGMHGFIDLELWNALRAGDVRAGEADDRWRLHVLLHQLVRGDFDDVPDLMTIAAAHRGVSEWELSCCALDVLGHVGTWELHGPLCRLHGAEYVTPGESVCHGMNYWLTLAGVPTLLDRFEENRFSDVLFIFPWAIQRILEEPEGDGLGSQWERQVPESDFEEYAAEAMSRYKLLVAEHGAHAAILRGAPFSVRRVAELLTSGRGRGRHVDDLAELFVAQTGLPADPLSVARFLARDADRFPVGVRHFFGRRLPDFAQERPEAPPVARAWP